MCFILCKQSDQKAMVQKCWHDFISICVVWCVLNTDIFLSQVVGGKMTDLGRLGAFITKVKKGSLADVVGHLRAGNSVTGMKFSSCFEVL